MGLQGNQLTRLEDLNLLRKYVCCLTHLDLRGNPLARAPSYAPLALRRLPHLATLDGKLLGEEDWEHAAASHGLLTVPMLEQCASTRLLSIWSTPGEHLRLLPGFGNASVVGLHCCWTVVLQSMACDEHQHEQSCALVTWSVRCCCEKACAQHAEYQDT